MTIKFSQLVETTSPKNADYVPVVEVNAGPSYISKRSTVVNLASTILQGNAASATKLATARTINGVSFDGTTNISIVTAIAAATSSVIGGVIIPVVATSGITNSSGTIGLAKATASTGTGQLGGVIPDGTTITVNGSGVITAPYTYTLPTASNTVLGGVKVDASTITINGSGVITAPYTYTLPAATSTVLGGVKPDGVTITNTAGAISVPTATSSVLGVVKPDGTTITNTSGAISVPTATTSALGIVRADNSSITISSGVLTATYSYSLPASTSTVLGGVIVQSSNISGLVNTGGSVVLAKASASDLGGVKIGTGVSIAADGTISTTVYSLPTATTSVLGGVKIDGSTITINSGTISSTISAATTSSLGGVIVPAVSTSGITNSSGTIGLATATATQLGGVTINDPTIAINGSNISVPMLTAAKIAIGLEAGKTSQGTNSVAIGAYAGQTSQATNTIILNASGSAVNGVSAQASSFYVNPIRSTAPQAGFVYYNSNTYEVVYSTSLGYPTGSSSGGTVTQSGSRTAGVTLNKSTGQITLVNVAASGTAITFTVTNSTVAAVDTIIVNCSSSNAGNVYLTFVSAVAAGTFNITFYTTGGVAIDSPVFNFTVIKGSNN